MHRQISLKSTNFRFHEELCGESGLDACGEIGGYEVADGCFSFATVLKMASLPR